MFHAVKGLQFLKSWDSTFTEGRILQNFDEDASLIHRKFDFKSSVAWDREVLYLECRKFDQAGLGMIMQFSVDSEMWPQKLKNYTRTVMGVINCGGFLIVPSVQDTQTCEVTYMLQLDTKGWVPSWFIANMGKEIVLGVEKLANFLANKKGFGLYLQNLID